MRLVKNHGKALKLTATSKFKQLTIFDENLIKIHMKRTKLALDKPVYCAMSILDISETLMYDFHYNFIKSKYGDRAKLLFEYMDGLA